MDGGGDGGRGAGDLRGEEAKGFLINTFTLL